MKEAEAKGLFKYVPEEVTPDSVKSSALSSKSDGDDAFVDAPDKPEKLKKDDDIDLDINNLDLEDNVDTSDLNLDEDLLSDD